MLKVGDHCINKKNGIEGIVAAINNSLCIIKKRNKIFEFKLKDIEKTF